MQLLDRGMPGLYALARARTDSDVLQYSRHEFHTHLLAHSERAPHALDPGDPNWHLDGTPHIDHDHQLLAIDGRLPTARCRRPAPRRASTSSSRPSPFSTTASSRASAPRSRAKPPSTATTREPASPELRATCAATARAGRGQRGRGRRGGRERRDPRHRHGRGHRGRRAGELLPVEVPSAAEDLGRLEVGNTTRPSCSRRGATPGERADRRERRAARDRYNLARPRDPLRDGEGRRAGDARSGDAPPPIPSASPCTSQRAATKSRSRTRPALHGVVYAPGAEVEVSGNGEFFGAFVGRTVEDHRGRDGALRTRCSRRPTTRATGGGPKAELAILRAKYRAGRVRIVARSSARRARAAPRLDRRRAEASRCAGSARAAAGSTTRARPAISTAMDARCAGSDGCGGLGDPRLG